MNRITRSSCAFFFLFFFGSLVVELVKARSLDAESVFVSAIVGILATFFFAVLSAADDTNRR